MIGSVLLVDDNPIDLAVTRHILVSHNLCRLVYMCESTMEAHSFLITATQSPDLIFVDINMPEMDGLAFLRIFESLPDNIKKKSKIIILSSNLKSDTTEIKNEHSSVVKCLAKPLSIEAINTFLPDLFTN